MGIKLRTAGLLTRENQPYLKCNAPFLFLSSVSHRPDTEKKGRGGRDERREGGKKKERGRETGR